MSKEDKMNEMMQNKVWAVVGATPNSEKMANRIYHTFGEHGYKAYPVNPNYGKMDDGGCRALNEMVCLKRQCPFFKPTKTTPEFENNLTTDEPTYPR